MKLDDKNNPDLQTWFTVAEAAAYIRVSRQTIYRYMDEGILAYFVLKTGGGRRISRADLDGLLEPPSEPTDEDS